MATLLNTTIEGNVLTIQIRGRFDYTAHRDFREAYEGRDLAKAKIVIDMANAEHLDSSALGMLLVLREKAGKEESDIEIRSCSDSIRKLFEVANFQKMFKIS